MHELEYAVITVGIMGILGIVISYKDGFWTGYYTKAKIIRGCDELFMLDDCVEQFLLKAHKRGIKLPHPDEYKMMLIRNQLRANRG